MLMSSLLKMSSLELRCHHCGRSHLATNCYFKDFSCHICHKKEHLEQVCRKKRARQALLKPQADLIESLECPGSDDCVSEDVAYSMFSLSSQQNKPLMIEVVVNNKSLQMQIGICLCYTLKAS